MYIYILLIYLGDFIKYNNIFIYMQKKIFFLKNKISSYIKLDVNPAAQSPKPPKILNK